MIIRRLYLEAQGMGLAEEENGEANGFEERVLGIRALDREARDFVPAITADLQTPAISMPGGFREEKWENRKMDNSLEPYNPFFLAFH